MLFNENIFIVKKKNAESGIPIQNPTFFFKKKMGFCKNFAKTRLKINVKSVKFKRDMELLLSGHLGNRHVLPWLVACHQG